MKKRKMSDKASAPKQDANSVAGMFGGFLGKAVGALRGRKSQIDKESEPKKVDPNDLESEREQNFSKVMKQYKKRAR